MHIQYLFMNIYVSGSHIGALLAYHQCNEAFPNDQEIELTEETPFVLFVPLLFMEITILLLLFTDTFTVWLLKLN